VYISPTDRVYLGDPTQITSTRVHFDSLSFPDRQPLPEALRRPGLSANRVRVFQFPAGNQTLRWVLGPNRQVTLGTQGHIDVGGRFLAGQHAQVRIDANGDAFLRVLSQPEGSPEAKAWIERANGGSNQIITAKDGWVPLGAKDSISMGGSSSFTLAEEIASSHIARIGDRAIRLNPREEVTIGRGDGQRFSPEGDARLDINHRKLSATHAKIGVDADGRMYIIDVGTEGRGSTNGTFVNGQRLRPNQRCYITAGDTIMMADLQVDLSPVTFAGDPVINGEVQPSGSRVPFRIAAAAIDPPPPTELIGTRVVGRDGNREIRMSGGLGEGLPPDTIRLTPAQSRALGSPESPFEAVQLEMSRNRPKVTYYRPRTNRSRFYILAEGSSEGPKLIRDYEVFLGPDGGGPPGPGGRPPENRPPGNRPPGSRPETSPTGSRPGEERPGSSPGGEQPRPEQPRPEQSGPERPSAVAPTDATRSGGTRTPPDPLRIETPATPFNPEGPIPRLDRPAAAMPVNTEVRFELDGGLLAVVPREKAAEFRARVEAEMGVDTLRTLLESSVRSARTAEEKAECERLLAAVNSGDTAKINEVKSRVLGDVDTRLAGGNGGRGGRSGFARVETVVTIAGVGVGIGILAAALLRHTLNKERERAREGRAVVQFISGNRSRQ